MNSIGKYGQINNMPTGWTVKNDMNKRIYQKWKDMFKRCYDSSQLSRSRGSSYKDCYVCPRWFYLSNFVLDITTLPNFGKAYNDGFVGWSIDKDSRVVDNKEYGPDTCMFLTNEDNIRERHKRCGTPMSDPELAKKMAISQGRPVIVVSPDGVVTEYYGTEEAARQLGCNSSLVSYSCSSTLYHTKIRGKFKGWSFYWADEYNS